MPITKKSQIMFKMNMLRKELEELQKEFNEAEEEEYLKQEREDSEYLYRLRKGDIETELE
jgi:mRNA-degrading endonuclease RelE of RelBE toxin-antitoxin system